MSSGVFLSYSRADRDLAEQVIRGLRGLGVDVWWDQDMPGVNWQRELARQIDELAAVLVLWTPHSVVSDNVADEARLGQHKDKLVNALAGVSSPPFPFDRTNGLPLDGWTGRESHNGWSRLITTLEDHLVRVGAAERGTLVHTLAHRDQEARAKRRDLSAAEEAYRAAKQEEGEVAAATLMAEATAKTAEDQLRRVIDMHFGASLLRAAQADLDAALSAKEEAEKARKAAAAALTAASRAMTRAKSELDRLFDETPLPVVPPPSAHGAAAKPAPKAKAQKPPSQPHEPPPAEAVTPPAPVADPDPVPAPDPAPDPGPDPGPVPEPETKAPVREPVATTVIAEAATAAPSPEPPAQPPPPPPAQPAPPAQVAPSPVAASPARPVTATASAHGGASAPSVTGVPSVAKPVSPATVIGIIGAILMSLVLIVVLAKSCSRPVDVTPAIDTNTLDDNATNAANAAANDVVNQGIAAVGAKNYAQAMDLLLPAATSGDGAAQEWVGYLYDQGDGVTQNYGEAKIWYQKSADQGVAGAENLLGDLYRDGHSVDVDNNQALAWYQRAADQGFGPAERNVGYMYLRGYGANQDYAQAMSWLQKGADHGDSDAVYWMATMYEQGLGMSAPDLATARQLYNKAADAGSDNAKQWLTQHPA